MLLTNEQNFPKVCFLLSIVLLLIESVKPNKGEKAHAKFESEKPYQSDLSIQQ